MVRYAWMALKFGFNSPFGPKFTVEFGNLEPKKFAWPNAHFMWVDITQVPLLLSPHFNAKCIQMSENKNRIVEEMFIADVLPIL